jgi:ubiquitin-like protein Pup
MRQHLERQTRPRRDREADRADAKRPERAATHDDLGQELDELLDEIDAVLEENAEEFVKAYVQKGGE